MTVGKHRVGAQIIEALDEAVSNACGRRTGIRKHLVRVPADVDVKAVRARPKMSQSQFAETFGFSLGTVQNWKRGHRRPEGAARALLKVIDRRPDAVFEALSS
jgi:putative transcriptional regulator